MALARFAAVPFPGPLIVPRTHAGPRRQAPCVPKPAHIDTHLSEYVPCRGDIHARNAIELRTLPLPWCHQLANLLIEGGNLPIQYLNQLSQSRLGARRNWQ